MRENLKGDKIQTGLRVPAEMYQELKRYARRSGASLNDTILLMVDIGLRAVNLGLQEEGRSGPHKL